MLSASSFKIMRGAMHEIDPACRIVRIAKPHKIDREPRHLGQALLLSQVYEQPLKAPAGVGQQIFDPRPHKLAAEYHQK